MDDGGRLRQEFHHGSGLAGIHDDGDVEMALEPSSSSSLNNTDHDVGTISTSSVMQVFQFVGETVFNRR